MSTPPLKSGFRLTVKTLGDYTAWLPNVPVGTTVRVEGPYGRFSFLYEKNTSYIWIGGGIGITPFVSMAYALDRGSCQADVYYATTTSEEAVYMPALEALVAGNPDLKVIPWYSKEQGRLTAEAVFKTSKDIQSRDIFICGPPPMMHSLVKQFRDHGIASNHIHSEEFGML
jgi:predicted ferric reductase